MAVRRGKVNRITRLRITRLAHCLSRPSGSHATQRHAPTGALHSFCAWRHNVSAWPSFICCTASAAASREVFRPGKVGRISRGLRLVAATVPLTMMRALSSGPSSHRSPPISDTRGSARVFWVWSASRDSCITNAPSRADQRATGRATRRHRRRQYPPGRAAERRVRAAGGIERFIRSEACTWAPFSRPDPFPRATKAPYISNG
jgi:hypothetical protein